MQKLVEIKNITAGYNGLIALDHVNLTINSDDFIGVIGPNGGGKTTLLKVILGLVKPLKGRIVYNLSEGENRINIGYLPQQFSADKKFPISVEQVVLSGLLKRANIIRGHSVREKDKVTEVITKMGIAGLRSKPFSELSGGETQRALLARAIISSPKLLLLDEPNTYVDQVFESELFNILEELNHKMAIVAVSHDAGMISSYVKTIACVNKKLHYHPSNEINNEILKAYNCPIDLITHGTVPHRVLKDHK
ncbi:MAG: ABC transporter ATP-binding protein [Bacteroidales bacterium]|nr:MAG: ABC transporter ATP-binding protein [Bacteroidales bacterium]